MESLRQTSINGLSLSSLQLYHIIGRFFNCPSAAIFISGLTFLSVKAIISALGGGGVKETIYSIPINESFEITDGHCPVCRLHRKLTEDTLDYILGAAMMEPDVRRRSNDQGFCTAHLSALLKRQKRLPLSLILQTHLDTLADNEKLLLGESPCFVCVRAGGFLAAYYSNIIYLWHKEDSFRKKWDDRHFICKPHAAGLAAAAPLTLHKKDAAGFLQSLRKKEEAAARQISESLGIFIRSFDHRFAGEPLGEHKQAVQRAAEYLAGVYENV